MNQTALDFSRPDMTVAHARADVGIERAVVRAEKVSPDWTQKAADMLRIGACVLSGKGVQKFTIEQLRTLVDGALPKPPDGRAWGGATRRATSLGFIVRLKGEYAPAESSNGSPKPMYAKGMQA